MSLSEPQLLSRRATGWLALVPAGNVDARLVNKVADASGVSMTVASVADGSVLVTAQHPTRHPLSLARAMAAVIAAVPRKAVLRLQLPLPPQAPVPTLPSEELPGTVVYSDSKQPALVVEGLPAAVADVLAAVGSSVFGLDADALATALGQRAQHTTSASLIEVSAASPSASSVVFDTRGAACDRVTAARLVASSAAARMLTSRNLLGAKSLEGVAPVVLRFVSHGPVVEFAVESASGSVAVLRMMLALASQLANASVALHLPTSWGHEMIEVCFLFFPFPHFLSPVSHRCLVAMRSLPQSGRICLSSPYDDFTFQ